MIAYSESTSMEQSKVCLYHQEEYTDTIIIKQMSNLNQI